MIDKSYIDKGEIKLEKIYHKNFVTKGWSYSPGNEISFEENVVCELMLHSNLSKLSMYFFIYSEWYWKMNNV
jgi:hypothetical protein